MNKAELVTAVAKRTGMTRKDTEPLVLAVFDSMTAALIEEEKVQILGFGTFEVKERKERTGKHPRTGEDMVYPATKAPSFKASKTLKDLIAKQDD